MSSTIMTPSSAITTSTNAKLPPSPASTFLPSPPGIVPGIPGLPQLSPAMMMGVGLLPQSMAPNIRPPTSSMNLSPRGGGLSPSISQMSPTSPNKHGHRFNNTGGPGGSRVMGSSPTKLTRMGQGQITCNCSQVFPNLDILERHMMSAHPENTNLVRNFTPHIIDLNASNISSTVNMY